MSATTAPQPGAAGPPTNRAAIERAVFVYSDRGAPTTGQRPQYSVGSGYLIGGNKVLTAAHVVEQGDIVVRLVTGHQYPARRVGVHAAEDVALLEVTDAAFPSGIPPAVFAQVDRASDDPVERCSAVGFPQFKQRRVKGQDRRDTAHLRGMIVPKSGLVSGHLELQVTATPRAIPQEVRGASEWAGLSGTAVCAYHPELASVVVGVVTQHHRPEGSSSLTIVPITELIDLDDWRTWLGIDAPDLPALPAVPAIAPSPYWATVAELARRTPVLLGRESELDYLAHFARGQVEQQHGFLWLVGHKWTGKTALTAHFVRNVPDDVDVVAYFLTPRGDATSDRFARVANDQLARLVGEGSSAETGDLDAFRMRWGRAVELAEENQRHLLLVVDGLDEDTSVERGLASVASVLPRLTGPWARVLVTSGPDTSLPLTADPTHPLYEPNLPADVDPAHPLYDARTRPLMPPTAEVVQRNRSIEANRGLCPLCKQKDEAEPVPAAVGKLGGGADRQPAAVGTLTSALELPHSDQSFMVGWAIRATVVGLLLLMSGCILTAAEQSTDEFSGETSSSGVGALPLLLGLAVIAVPWGIIIHRSNVRSRCRPVWMRLRYCHRDQIVFQSQTGEWCYPGQLTPFLLARVKAQRQAQAATATPYAYAMTSPTAGSP